MVASSAVFRPLSLLRQGRLLGKISGGTAMESQVFSQTNQCLTFVMDEEFFAVEIDSVREVLELTTITRVPRTSEFMRGVINLRGNAVPVVDMRCKFGMPKAEDTINTCIIILEIESDNEVSLMGALVDAVREVIEIRAEDIQPAPKMGTAVSPTFIKGMGRQGDEFVIILDIQKLFSLHELTTLHATRDLVSQAEVAATPVA
jgi:purine-binding chemotaxis protein CheW